MSFKTYSLVTGYGATLGIPELKPRRQTPAAMEEQPYCVPVVETDEQLVPPLGAPDSWSSGCVL